MLEMRLIPNTPSYIFKFISKSIFNRPTNLYKQKKEFFFGYFQVSHHTFFGIFEFHHIFFFGIFSSFTPHILISRSRGGRVGIAHLDFYTDVAVDFIEEVTVVLTSIVD